MADSPRRPLLRRIAAVAAAGCAVALVVGAALPASAQYYGPPQWGYPPPPYYYPAQRHYSGYPNVPAWEYDTPYPFPLLNDPGYPCVWEGRGCPTGR